MIQSIRKRQVIFYVCFILTLAVFVWIMHLKPYTNNQIFAYGIQLAALAIVGQLVISYPKTFAVKYGHLFTTIIFAFLAGLIFPLPNPETSSYSGFSIIILTFLACTLVHLINEVMNHIKLKMDTAEAAANDPSETPTKPEGVSDTAKRLVDQVLKK